MRSGTAVDEDVELRRLREALYRPSPPPGAVERYTALLADRPVERPAARSPHTEVEVLGEGEASTAGPTGPVRPVRGRRALLLAVPLAVLAVALVAAAVLRPVPRDPGAAEPLVAGGPYAVSDREALDSLTDRRWPDPRSLLRAVQGSELAQLDVWDTREAGVWVQQGLGPMTRRFEGRTSPSEHARPFSIVIRCPAPARYRWTIIGTTPARPAVHVLETAAADCGRAPTVATFSRTAGAAVRGFDLAVPDGLRWGMAFVYPVGD